ncbi:hypothetical protein BDB01DRAFT_716734 [Pilobolus umbonatus]|nr:hypothetical protein BDB01DRAFT_716734 [Pilobolus umbonatus]
MSFPLTSAFYPRSIGLFTNGLFTGLSFCMNIVAVPSIRASKDPLPVFTTVYKNASKLAIANIMVGAAANLICYYRTKDNKFLLIAALGSFSFPWTVFFIAPVNNKLFAMEKEGDHYNRRTVDDLVQKWNKLQYVRTITGTAAFLINILY